MERRKICRYFERGSCKKDNCPFNHLKEGRKTCDFYLEGRCKRGNTCNFYHPPKEEEKLAGLKEELKNKIKEENKPKIEHESEEQGHEEAEKEEHHSDHEFQVLHQEEEDKKKDEKEKEKEKIEIKEEEKLQYLEPKVEETHRQVHQELDKQKLKKINFLLCLNEDSDSESSEQQEVRMEKKTEKVEQPRHIIQFTKLYPKKFVDINKTPEMRAKIKQNQAIFFKDQKFLDIINRLQDPTEKQYYQIVRKFTDTFSPIQGDFFHFTIKMRPLLFQKQINLHFQFKEDLLNLEIDGRKYPKERAVIKILNESIPDDYKQKIYDFLNKYHASKSVVDTLKFLQNNFERIYKESHFKLQNQFYSRKDLQKKIQQELSKPTGSGSISQPKPKKKKEKSAANQNPFVVELKYQEGEKVNHLNYNYELTADSIVMQNCEYLVIEKILLYLQCVCEQKIMYIYDGTNERSLKVDLKLKCKKCHNTILFGLERQVVQLKREALGKIGVGSGHLIDVGGLAFKIGCICNNQISKGRIMLPGERLNANCHNCFQSAHISYMGLKFYNPTLKIPQVRMDHELPGKGACKHMKLTFRWYRYGCCGRCFSCDDCHIMNSIVVHQKLKGITMLCGYCSMEQPLADICAHCHKVLVKGMQKTGHWEGGYGCRDQATLSRKDHKKYTGVTKKKEKEK